MRSLRSALAVVALIGAGVGAVHAQPRAGSQFGNGSGTVPAPVNAPAQPSWSTTPAWTVPAASAAPRGATTLATPAANAAPAAPTTLARPATAKAATSTATPVARKGDLFSVDDQAVVKGNGTETSVGAIKKELLAQIGAKAGPMKTIKASSRSLSVGAAALAVAPGRPRSGRDLTATATHNSAIADLYCSDKGPPTLLEVDGTMRAGGHVKLWGKCFGDRTGRVEVVGPFPGGKLAVAFTSWAQTLIEVDVPATVRGAPDATVAVSVVTADGKKTSAAQASFVAARERVEVPDRMWSPTSAFESVATSNNQPNPAEGGVLARTVRINPQCGLESMVTDVIAGDVLSIDGFDRGPPNEAAVTIAWRGTCVTTTTWTTHNYVIVQTGADVSISEACRVALRPRAWAQCPAGIAP